MTVIKEWKWERTIKSKDKKVETFCCPYCNFNVCTTSDTRIFDVETGAIKYNIFKCVKCYMPTTIGIDGEIIPTSRFLPFGDIQHLPIDVGKLYCECRKAYAVECFCSVITVARTILMYIAVNLGANTGCSFAEYVNYLETENYISQHDKAWVDKIRLLGNQYVHQLAEATEEEARKAMVFISHLLSSVYELPQMAK
jgi:hypothetical protein